jgi:hypothetical protein
MKSAYNIHMEQKVFCKLLDQRLPISVASKTQKFNTTILIK